MILLFHVGMLPSYFISARIIIFRHCYWQRNAFIVCTNIGCTFYLLLRREPIKKKKKITLLKNVNAFDLNVNARIWNESKLQYVKKKKKEHQTFWLFIYDLKFMNWVPNYYIVRIAPSKILCHYLPVQNTIIMRTVKYVVPMNNTVNQLSYKMVFFKFNFAWYNLRLLFFFLIIK